MISERERFSETLRTHRRRAPVDEWLQEFCIDEKLKQPQYRKQLTYGLLPVSDAALEAKSRILRELDMGKRALQDGFVQSASNCPRRTPSKSAMPV